MVDTKVMQEKNWLIKSSSKILGPFSAVEIAQLLIKKHVSIIDEARQPQSRWTYIRENAIFAEVVQSLRTEQSSQIEETVNTSPGSQTQTISRTDWIQSNTATPTPSLSSAELGRFAEPLKDVTATAGAAAAAKATTKSFGMEGDRRVNEKIEGQTRAFSYSLWIITLVVAIIVGALAYKKFSTNPRVYEDLIAQALKYNQIQLYSKSLEYLKRAQEIHEIDQKTLYQMALPMIQAEKQSLMARRVLEKGLLSQNLTAAEIVDGYIGIALTYSGEGDLKTAQDFLGKALAIDPKNIPAAINSAFNDIKKGDYGAASKILDGLPPSAIYSPYVIFGEAMIAIESKSRPADRFFRRLDELTARPSPLRKELALLLVVLHGAEKNQVKVSETIKRFVEIPIRETKEFVQDPRLDLRVTDWDYLEKYSARLYSDFPDVPLIKIFRAHALMEQQRGAEALRLIDEAAAESPNDRWVKLTQANYFFAAGGFKETIVLLNNAALDGFSSQLLLWGLACLKLKEKNCAKEKLEKGLQKNPDDIRYLAQVSSFYLTKETAQKGWELVRQGFAIQPQYRLLIENRDLLENQ